MKTIRLYRHPDCDYCAQMSKLHKKMDWLGRVELSTEPAKGAPLRRGEIEVEQLATGETFRGAAALSELAKQIPAYMVLRPLLLFGGVHRYLDRRLSGCDGEMCAMPNTKQGS